MQTRQHKPLTVSLSVVGALLAAVYSFAYSIPDTDGDGYNDLEDECPYVMGDLRGCPDIDNDGWHDYQDSCPLVPGPVNGCPPEDD